MPACTPVWAISGCPDRFFLSCPSPSAALCSSLRNVSGSCQRHHAVLLLVVEEDRAVRKTANQVIAPVLSYKPKCPTPRTARPTEDIPADSETRHAHPSAPAPRQAGRRDRHRAARSFVAPCAVDEHAEPKSGNDRQQNAQLEQSRAAPAQPSTRSRRKKAKRAMMTARAPRA